jgi:hypothetical protein
MLKEVVDLGERAPCRLRDPEVRVDDAQEADPALRTRQSWTTRRGGKNAHPEERRQLFPVPGRRVNHVWRQHRADDADDVAGGHSSARI